MLVAFAHPTESIAPKLLTALKAALPYVNQFALLAPDQSERRRRAYATAADIRAIIAVAEGRE